MYPFAYRAARSLPDAVARAAQAPAADVIAGGTDLIQLLQENVRAPSELIDINALPLTRIETDAAGGLRIGALVRMAELARHATVREHYPVIAEALLASASPQVRNQATIGGNLLQRTRCLYFRDHTTPCNRREPGSGCGAMDGIHRMNAILGVSAHCIATHASDLAVALVALDARLHLAGPAGEREIALADLHREPGDRPQDETILGKGELITGVTVPAAPFTAGSHYLKVRDRASFEWALVSAAAALEVADGTIRQARVAAGGVATKPWRLPQVEAALTGRPPTMETVLAAAETAAEGANPRPGNAFKVELLKRTVARAVATAGARA
jgi:xanthine dehydrogenase YagS FAD-binding subunit